MAKKTTRNQKQAEQAARKRRHIRIIAGIIMVTAAAGLAFGGLFWYQKEQKAQKAVPDSSDYADVLSSYYTAVLSADGQTLTQLMAPPEYWTYYMKTYSKSEDDVVESFTEGCNNTVQEWKETYGDDVKVTYQIQGMSSQGDAGVSEWNTDMEKMLGNEGADTMSAPRRSASCTFGSPGRPYFVRSRSAPLPRSSIRRIPYFSRSGVSCSILVSSVNPMIR